jgi:hypothetical protein
MTRIEKILKTMKQEHKAHLDQQVPKVLQVHKVPQVPRVHKVR